MSAAAGQKNTDAIAIFPKIWLLFFAIINMIICEKNIVGRNHSVAIPRRFTDLIRSSSNSGSTGFILTYARNTLMPIAAMLNSTYGRPMCLQTPRKYFPYPVSLYRFRYESRYPEMK